MRLNPKRTALLIMTVFMMTSFGMNVNAQTLFEENMINSDENNAVYMEYDSDTNTYELTDENGNAVTDADSYYSEIQTAVSETLPAVTETSSITSQTTTVSASAAQTAVTAVTVDKYKGRLRAEATTTTTVTTTKATTTTKKTTTIQAAIVTRSYYNGIDVSRHQGDINWKKVKDAGIDFVMIRAGYGMEYDQVDGNFHKNIKAAQAVGLECGVYWYSYAVSTSEALREAEVCYSTIKGYKLSYPVSFDIEDPSQSYLSETATSNITKVFCDYLEKRSCFVSVYSYASLLKDKMNSSVLSKYDIWVAHTGVTKPSYSGSYGMWQYSHTGRVNGITGNVDLDYGYKYYPDIMKKYKLNGYS